MTAPRDHYLRVRLTADQLAAIQRIAAQDGATVSEVVRRIVADEVRRSAGPPPLVRPKPHPPIVRDVW